jgi:hypothetical protein
VRHAQAAAEAAADERDAAAEALARLRQGAGQRHEAIKLAKIVAIGGRATRSSHRLSST